jgi:hypothetical protein
MSPDKNELRRLLHALREPVSAFAIHAAHCVEHMTKSAGGDHEGIWPRDRRCDPLALLSQNGHARPETR